ncbi:MAG: IS4 family transposase [Planctomycetes bacterium]|nr:IS4 family transposase [Planctomycetota bacterium]
MRKGAKRPEPLPIWPETVQGGRQVRLLEQHVRQLRNQAAHGNQQLLLDDVVVAHLLAFFNPTLRSLRTLEDFSQTRQAQRHLTVRRLCKSTLSDFHALVDPTLLQPLIQRLHAAAQAQGGPRPADLPATLAKVLAVDGSFFAVAADVAWAIKQRSAGSRRHAGVRLDLHLDIGNWLPEVIDVCGQGTSEAASAARSIQPGAIHVYDRGIFSFALLAAQVKAQAFFVHRLREAGARSPRFVAETTRPLTAAEQAQGIVSDQPGRLAGSPHRPAPDIPLREVVVQGDGGEVVRLLTNLLDVEASVIATIYRYRWQVELFFRWLKVFANFSHLISEQRSGILLSFYVAVIGVLLLDLHSGAKPSKYAFSLLGMAAQGASLAEIAPILAERERRVALDRASLARRKARAKNQA